MRKSRQGKKPMLGKKHSEETKRKMRESHKKLGQKLPSWLGKKRSEESRRKMSISHKNSKNKSIFPCGNKNPSWKGGISFEPYSTDWTRSLKISIRERDKYTCQICKEKQGDKAFSIHHINYVKTDCNPENLITLCHSCHSRTNNNREYWTDYFKYVFINSFKK